MYDETNFIDNYYEQSSFWVKVPTDADKKRIATIISLIPNDVDSVIDVGCGDGMLSNRLSGKVKKVIAMDNSNEALKHVKTEKIYGSIDFIPFGDREFHISICAEVLEHLPKKVFHKAIQELERVSEKYIIISVPNNEQIEQGYVKCDDCGCIYSGWRHMRSFDHQKMLSLFSNFVLEKTIITGPIETYYNYFLLRAKRFSGGGYSNPSTAICPQCGSNNCYKSKRNILTLGVGFLNKLIPAKKRRRWNICLYKRP